MHIKYIYLIVKYSVKITIKMIHTYLGSHSVRNTFTRPQLQLATVARAGPLLRPRRDHRPPLFRSQPLQSELRGTRSGAAALAPAAVPSKRGVRGLQ